MDDETVRNSFSGDSLDGFAQPYGILLPSSSRDLETRGPPLAPLAAHPRLAIPGKPRSPEKVLRQNVRLSKVSTGAVDVYTDDQTLSADFVAEMKKRTILLYIRMYNCSTCRIAHFEGQVFIVGSADHASEFYMTALHNMLSENNKKGEWEECSDRFLVLPGGDPEDAFRVEFADKGRTRQETDAVVLRDGHLWKTGNEVCRGPRADPRAYIGNRQGTQFRGQVEPFTVVDTGFQYHVGLSIAIVVYTQNKNILTKLPKDFGLTLQVTNDNTQGFFSKLFGRLLPNFCKPQPATSDLIITTGEITEVGQDHIEYNVNTIGGHSGGVVVVRSPSHPYYMHAIAVQAGFKEGLGQNIGFKLQGMSFDD